MKQTQAKTAPNRSKAFEVAFQFAALHQHLPSRTIARLLVKERPLLFNDVEHARDYVRRLRGNVGADHRRCNIGGSKLYRPPGSQCDGIISMPPPLPEKEPWQIVQVDCKKALIISDIHVPFHDAKACDLAISHGVEMGVDCVVINGDLCDFYAISFWDKDPEVRNFRGELESCRMFLEWLRSKFPKARIIFKEGNHEERIWRYAWKNCPDFAGLPEFGLGELLYLSDYGIELVKDKKPIRLGEHLHLLHGHEFRAPFVNPVNPARGLYLRAKCNALCGDLHQTSEHTESGIVKTVSCWSAGALCGLRPRYAPLNRWNQGFATYETHRSAWKVDNLRIINGEVV